MAFLGDLIVKMGADINPFQNAMKKAQSITHALKSSLSDMRTTAGVFAKLAAAIKATNNQMDRLVHVSKGALSATNNLATAENHQFKLRMQQLKMIADAQRRANPQQSGGGSMIGAGIAGGIAGSIASGVSGMASSGVGLVADMGIGMVNLAADAEVAQMNFEILLGDAAKGAKMFKDIENFAGRTSFNIESASEAATRLLATGVDESKVITTMQLLGDLALGDANKLGFLSKAYTDVMNKGRLQAQETKQFSENGIGLMAALSETTGKTIAELTVMQEQGAISFQMVQEALIGLTTGTGRFTDALEKGNTTFKGQWNSLMESIQGFGRDLGAMVLPALKDITSETNKFLQAFRQVEDKSKVIGELLDAGMSVGFEFIKENWQKMLDSMVEQAGHAALKIADKMNPLGPVQQAFGLGQAAGGKMNDIAGRQGGLEGAKQRFQDVMDRIKANKPPEEAPVQLIDPAQPDNGLKLRDLAGGLAESAKNLFDQAALAAQNKITDLKIKGEYVGSIVKNMFGVGAASGDDKKKVKAAEETKFAGAMNRGSQEAYSTLVNAMARRKDPVVTATEKQTKQLVAAINKGGGKKVKLVAEFAT